MAGLISQISPFATGEISELVNAEIDEETAFCSYSQDSGENAKRPVNISELVISGRAFDEDRGLRNRFALLFSLSALSYQQMASTLGKLISQEIAWAVGEREKMKNSSDDLEFLSLFLDEFSEFVYEGFISTLNKARSARVGIHLSHQSLGDLQTVSHEFANQVNTNTNIKCLLGLNDPETADFYARHIGTESITKMTKQMRRDEFWSESYMDGDSASMRDVEAYKVHPNLLKNFSNGEGVLHLPTPRGVVSEVIQFDAYESA